MTGGTMIRPLLAAAADDAAALVICPFAGGSASAFRGWWTLADPPLDVSIVTYPGRDHRLGERCAETSPTSRASSRPNWPGDPRAGS